MRRGRLFLVLLSLLAACATPEIRLEPHYRSGEVRTYRLTAEATIRIRAGGLDRRERTRLLATSRIEVLEATPAGARLRVRLQPERFERDGASADPPPGQEAVLAVGAAGEVTKVERVGGVPPELSGAEVEDFASLLGLRMPQGRVRIGDRWRFPVTGPGGRSGETRGRLAAVRIVGGYDCAIVAASVRRPIARDRALLGGVSLSLDGEEISATEIAFAFADGFPVRIESTGEATLNVSGLAGEGGTVEIATETQLDLASRAAPEA